MTDKRANAKRQTANKLDAENAANDLQRHWKPFENDPRKRLEIKMTAEERLKRPTHSH